MWHVFFHYLSLRRVTPKLQPQAILRCAPMGLFHDLERVVIGETQRPQFFLHVPPCRWEASAFQKLPEVLPAGILHHSKRPMKKIIGAVLNVYLLMKEIHVDHGTGPPPIHVGHPQGTALFGLGIQIPGHRRSGSIKPLGDLPHCAAPGQKHFHGIYIGRGELLSASILTIPVLLFRSDFFHLPISLHHFLPFYINERIKLCHLNESHLSTILIAEKVDVELFDLINRLGGNSYIVLNHQLGYLS